MRKSLLIVVSFALLILLTVAAGCVPLPASTSAAGSQAPTYTTAPQSATTVAPAETIMTATAAATSGEMSTPIAGPTAEVSTAIAGPTAALGTAVPAETGPTAQVGTAIPPVEPTPTQPASGEGRSVTLDDSGKTVTLQPGDRFLLNLGEGYNWDVTIADQNVVSRVVGVLTIRGSQGLFEARQPGTTTLTATGDPVCRSQQPACEAPSRMFEVQIVVTPGTS